tara:strand:+ start:15171 stop:16163 length:993 start_codon:yes stop_codon:yes gene_type:complete
MEFAHSAWAGELLCVTGTNGKTTLTTLLEQALNRNGETAVACGNIGTPLSSCALESPQREWAAAEVSSFQLHDWAQPSGDVAFWTNFAEDHLDWHSSMRDYFEAKWRLVASGIPVYAEQEVGFHAKQFGFAVPDNLILVNCGEGFAIERGLFAVEPYARLYRLAQSWWTDSGRDPGRLKESALEFQPLSHRCETIAEGHGRRFVNDSKATNFHAALAACESVSGPIAWIGGGLSKGGDLARFARAIAGRIATADLIGGTADELSFLLEQEGVPVVIHGGLDAAVRSAFRRSGEGGTILFSPGFASFDQFSGYADRGEVYRRVVLELLNPR